MEHIINIAPIKPNFGNRDIYLEHRKVQLLVNIISSFKVFSQQTETIVYIGLEKFRALGNVSIYEKRSRRNVSIIIVLYCLKDLSHEFEFETLLVKISQGAFETPKTKKIESRHPLGSTIQVVQKKPRSLPLAAFLFSRNQK